jgi:nucleotide-binding universal stress UspA family protein
MKKILIAIDYNPCSQKIAETGFEYARAMNAEVCIVHAIADIAYYSMEYAPIMGFKGFSPDSAYKNIEEQEKEAEDFLSAVVKHLGGMNIETKVLNGKTSETILQYADEYNASMIVMGSQSHSSFEKILIGNVVADVLKHSFIPVMIVPTDKQDLNIISRKHDVLHYI